jgi:hypothetical protein
MADCCNDKQCAIEALRTRQAGTLRIVLGINAVMFVVEFASGLLARSTALLGRCQIAAAREQTKVAVRGSASSAKPSIDNCQCP